MSGIGRLNRELEKLDTALRGGTIDRPRFRAERRRLLLEFEERQIVTTPGTVSPTVIGDPPPETSPLTPPHAPRNAASAGTGRSRRALIALCVAGLVTAALALGWTLRSPPPSPASPASSESVNLDLPQGVAAALMQSSWTSQDLSDFLSRWQRLPADAVVAADNDPKIWLLRGQTDQRLREAREAQSVAPSAEGQQRVQQMERVQAAIRPR